MSKIKILAYLGSFILLIYSLFYIFRGISSGDHWKFVETTVGLFLAALLAYWAKSLDTGSTRRTVVNKRIKKAILVAVIIVGLIFWGFMIIFGLGMSADNK